MTPDEAMQAREIVSDVMDRFVAVVDGACKSRHERSNSIALDALKQAQANARELAMLVGDNKSAGRLGTVERDVGAAHNGIRALADRMEVGMEKLANKLDAKFEEQNKRIWQITVRLAAMAAGAAASVAIVAKLLGLS